MVFLTLSSYSRFVPSRGKSKTTQITKQKIALGKATGRLAKDIAEDLGVCKSTVEHEALKPDVKSMIETLQERHRDQLEALYAESLRGLGDDVKHFDGDIRVRSRAQVFKLVEGQKKNTVTFEGEFSLSELWAHRSKGEAA